MKLTTKHGSKSVNFLFHIEGDPGHVTLTFKYYNKYDICWLFQILGIGFNEYEYILTYLMATWCIYEDGYDFLTYLDNKSPIGVSDKMAKYEKIFNQMVTMSYDEELDSTKQKRSILTVHIGGDNALNLNITI